MAQSDYTEVTISNEDRRGLLGTAREAILAKLTKREPMFQRMGDVCTLHNGAFVTLHLTRSGSRLLRGCIGYIQPAFELPETVRRAALAAAFSDFRFPPLSLQELPSVDIEISVLSDPTVVRNIEDVRPGIHGLIVHRGSRSGLLLPQVAVERGWNRRSLLEHTCIKAGIAADSYKEPGTTLETFTALVFGEVDFGKVD